MLQQMMQLMAQERREERRLEAAQKREDALFAAQERRAELAQMRADALKAEEAREAAARRATEERREESARIHDLLTQVLVAKAAPSASGASSSSAPLPATDHHPTHLEKVAFSKYDGKMDAMALHSWLHQFTAYFSTCRMTNHGKVLLAAIYLSGDAINWYQSWQDEQLATHLASGLTDDLLQYEWATFHDQLKARFMPPEYLQRLQDDWKSLKQSGSPVMTFSNKVMQIGVQLRKSDSSRLKAFIYGLDD